MAAARPIHPSAAEAISRLGSYSNAARIPAPPPCSKLKILRQTTRWILILERHGDSKIDLHFREGRHWRKVEAPVTSVRNSNMAVYGVVFEDIITTGRIFVSRII
jgi:hypothetical protein